MTFVVCPFCRSGRAVQLKPRIIACPNCGLRFRLVKIKEVIRKCHVAKGRDGATTSQTKDG